MATQGWREGGGGPLHLPLASGSVPVSWTTKDKAFISFWKERQALSNLSLSPLLSAPSPPIHRVDQLAMANLPLPKTEHYLESFLAEEAAGEGVGSHLFVGSEQDF